MRTEEIRVDGPMRADRWLAVVRIVVGLWFLKSISTKLTVFLAFGFLPLPRAAERWIGVMPMLLSRYAESVQVGWYREFLTDFVVPNGAFFAHTTALGEAVVGIGLTLGLGTRVAAAVGLLIMINYLVATFGVGQCQQGFHILLVTCMVAFLMSAAGRTWGVDGHLLRRRPDSPLAEWRLI